MTDTPPPTPEPDPSTPDPTPADATSPDATSSDATSSEPVSGQGRRRSRLALVAASAVLATVVAAGALTAQAADGPAPTVAGSDTTATTCLTRPDGRAPAGTTPVRGEVVVSGLKTPWGIGWLPDGSMLVTEREGAVRHVDAKGELRDEPVVRVPATESSEGGLLGIAVHPDFASNRTFYVFYTSSASEGRENVVERYVLAEGAGSATSAGTIVTGIPAAQFHSGGRLRFGPDGKLYIGTGDASQPKLAQDPSSLAGKLLRVNDDGTVPEDNPDPASPVWLSGVRNTQGFDWRADGRIVMTDHGPSGAENEGGRTGHDEITLAQRGDDLGWPHVTGCEQRSGSVTPSLTWTEAVPPGGAAIYTGDEIPEWKGDLFVGVLGLDKDVGHLHRVRLDDAGTVTLDEAYVLDGGYGRIRDVVMGPDGGLYVTTSNCDGRGECGDGDRIVRVRPQVAEGASASEASSTGDGR